MFQKLLHLYLTIREGPILSTMYGLVDIRAVLNLVNLDYHQSVEECHPNLVLKFTYMKDLYGLYPFNISGVDGGK